MLKKSNFIRAALVIVTLLIPNLINATIYPTTNAFTQSTTTVPNNPPSTSNPSIIPPSQPRANQLPAQSISFESIRNLRNSGQLARAKSDALIYLQNNPNDADVKLLLGLIYYQEKNYVESQKLAISIINQVPKYEDARVLLINNLITTGKNQAAIVQINEGLKYNPNSLQLQNLKMKLTTPQQPVTTEKKNL